METIPNSKDNLKSEQFILFRSLTKHVRRTYLTVSLFLGLLVTKGQPSQEDEDGRDGAAGGEGRRWLGENWTWLVVMMIDDRRQFEIG